MPRLTTFVLAHRRLVVLAWVVLTVAGAWAAATISESLSQSFDAPGRPAFAANREIVGTFGTGGVVPPAALVIDARDGERLDRARVADRLRAVGEGVRGARLVLPDAPGGEALLSADGRTAVGLVFPPPGRPAPDANPEAVAQLRAAAAGGPVVVTGIDALVDDTGGGGAGLLIEVALGGLGALIVLGAGRPRSSASRSGASRSPRPIGRSGSRRPSGSRQVGDTPGPRPRPPPR